MQKWQINGTIQSLCNECAKTNLRVFLLYPHKWLGEEKDAAAACDCCRCTDQVVGRFGRLRWLFYPFLSFLPRPWPAALRTPRRAK
ncbi:hypothetical protein ACUUL3_00810 [Thiovibrio sp. JS02]